jgi:hypothetical protein
VVDLAAAVTRARDVIATVLVDACVISFDANGNTDRTLVAGTARLAADPDTPASVYTGPCLLIAAGQPEQQVQPATPIAVGTWRLLLPYTAPDIPRGAKVRMTATSDPALLTMPLFAHATVHDSLNAVRAVDVRQDAPR